MGKGVVYPFSSNSLFVISRRIEKEAVDKMIAHFVTAPFFMAKSKSKKKREKYKGPNVAEANGEQVVTYMMPVSVK